ncbi:MAG: 30S ribosomal protein S16 [Candidatus Pacebacteria bacterium]|nr:30S ribosomal protein S16 [Candidatus Paceibacterota bacterium]
MLKIRLQRVGKKNDPSFRIVLTDVRQGPKSGKFIENLGFYDAIRKIKQIKKERVQYWIANGARVSGTVHNILVGEKIIAGKKINVLPKKTPLEKKIEKTEKKAASLATPLEGEQEKTKEKEEIIEKTKEKSPEKPQETKKVEENKAKTE